MYQTDKTTDDQKQKLGAYYTPYIVTDTLSKWAIKSSTDTILEPSFGGCNFLTSSIKLLESIGNQKPSNNIYGFDIDPKAFLILDKRGIENTNFELQDFLESKKYLSLSVDIVLGNPPYLPIHKLETNYKAKLYENFAQSKIKIPRRSSLWIYFIVKSLEYLKRGGKMAWVVPDSICFTDYGREFLKQIQPLFMKIDLIRIDERYFSEIGTAEKTSILLCEGYKIGKTEVRTHSFMSLNEALHVVEQLGEIGGLKKTSLTEVIPEKSNSKYNLVELGSICKIKIGIVLGASELLLSNKKEAQKTPYFPRFMYPVVSKGKQLSGISVSRSALVSDIKSPIYLVDAVTMELEEQKLFEEFLLTIPSKVLINQTFRKRGSLFGYDDYNHPDAFLTFYSQGLPKIVLNQQKELNCTNSVHRLYLRDEYRSDSTILKFIALQSYVDYTGELTKPLARQYGSGILKFEPSDALKLSFYIPISNTHLLTKQISNVFERVKFLCESNKIEKAKQVASDFLKQTILSH